MNASAPTRRPARVVLVPPTAFADDYADRPSEPIAVGLRLLSETHVTGARAEASKQAVARFTDDEADIADHRGFDEAYNDALLEHLVAAAICDPNSVTAAHPLFPYAADQVPGAFSPEGLRFLYDELARVHHEASPLVPPITADGVAELVALLQSGAYERQPRVAQLATGKLLTHCLEQLRGDVAVLPVTPFAAPAAP
jgi:hypothetical protein